ncbi:right-handed parallel beta-helix repeat-containing protein [Carboxylicivirga taeanensis]|uniref:right-handed parallel beta-helix repeat-containing protein n=1 Tax=Carboxylicivirga taeanensis TaxID=1416875 RepID=UPI003F6DE3E7
MKRVIIIAMMFTVIIACEENALLNTATDSGVQAELKAYTEAGIDVYIGPSGDLSGMTDANNIETGLNFVKASGGTVFLTDGNPTTTDHFYTSRNIVADGFKGCLKGEAKHQTLLHAGRQSELIGFQGAESPWWAQTDGHSFLATVIQLDNALGDVTLKDFSIHIEDAQPTNLMPDYYGVDATYISTFIEILGGEHDTYIEDIELIGMPSQAEGNIMGMNVSWGIHVMLGQPSSEGNNTGNLHIRNVSIENTGDAAFLCMRFGEGSNITIDQISANLVGQGLTAMNLYNSSVQITNSYVKSHPLGFPGMFFTNVPTGLYVADNSFESSRYWGLFLHHGVNNALVQKNRFISMTDNVCFGAVLLRGMNNTITHNDYRQSELPSWDNGAGAVLLTNTSQHNYVHEMKFNQKPGVTLCAMLLDLTDNPETYEYDGANTIHNYQPCENLAKRTLKHDVATTLSRASLRGK